MSNYKTFQKIHDNFQSELDLAKSNLGKAKMSEALNFPGFIESNEQVLNFYSEVDSSYIENIFNSNINNDIEILNESIGWLKKATSNLIKFNQFCTEARNRGDITEEKEKRDRCLRIADRKFDKPSAYKSGAVVRCRKGDIWKDIKEVDNPQSGKAAPYGSGFAKVTEEMILEKVKETLRTWFKRKGEPGKKGGWVDCNTCREVDGKTKCKACGREKGEKRAEYPSCRPTAAQCKTPGKGIKWGKTK
jgi:hypothetical protein